MKNLITLPVVLILWTGLFCLALLAFSIPGLAAESSSMNFSLLFFKIVGMGKIIFLSALLLGLLAAHKRILHGRGRAYPSLFVLLLTVASVLYAALFGLAGIQSAGELGGSSPFHLLVEDRVFRTDGKYLWIGEDEGFTVRTILVHDGFRGKQGFHVYSQGLYSPERNSLRLLETGKEIPLEGTIPVRVPAYLKRIGADMVYMADSLSPKKPIDINAAVFCLFFSLLLVSLHTPLRLTRWPLFNFLISAGGLLAFFTGYRFFNGKFLPEVMKLVSGFPVSYAPLGFILIPGLVLVLSGLLLRPLREWRRDVGYE